MYLLSLNFISAISYQIKVFISFNIYGTVSISCLTYLMPVEKVFQNIIRTAAPNLLSIVSVYQNMVLWVCPFYPFSPTDFW